MKPPFEKSLQGAPHPADDSEAGIFRESLPGDEQSRCRVSLLILFVLFFLTGNITPAWAQSKGSVIITPGTSKVEVGPFLEQLEDPDGKMTLADVRSPQTASRFLPNTHRDVHIGHTRSAWWFRFRLQKAPAASDKTSAGRHLPTYFIEFDKPGLHAIDLYIPQKSDSEGSSKTRWKLKQTGMGRPCASRDIPFRTYILQLPDTFAESEYFYVRIQSVMSINTQVTVRSAASMAERVWLDALGFGIIYGVMAAMILYNLCLVFFLRDRIYFFYIIYMASMLVYLLFGYGQLAALVPIPPAFHETLFWIILGNIWFWSIAFVREFLDTRRNIPRLDRFFQGFIVIAVVLMFSGLFHLDRLANIINNVISPVGSFIGFLAAVLCIRKGFRPAWYFLIAWSVLLIGLTLYSAGGIIMERSFMAIYTIAIGSAIEAILLSFALAERIRVLRVQKEELERNEGRLKELTLRDSLTDLYNRRYMMAQLAGEIETAHRLGSSLAILMIDVDHFKSYNDTYGHPEGDKVLVRMGRVLLQCARQSDTACRYGGEEFTVILRGAGIEEGMQVAERIRQTIVREPFFPRPAKAVPVSVSIGVTSLKEDDTEDALIRRADEALYRAKAAGRNRVYAF